MSDSNELTEDDRARLSAVACALAGRTLISAIDIVLSVIAGSLEAACESGGQDKKQMFELIGRYLGESFLQLYALREAEQLREASGAAAQLLDKLGVKVRGD